MDDTISRQAAIDAFAPYAEYESNLTNADWVRRINTVLSALPSAQPERKTGKWQETDDGWDGVFYVCSECGCSWTLIDGTPSDNGMNFCPHCGCQMREAEDDEQSGTHQEVELGE